MFCELGVMGTHKEGGGGGGYSSLLKLTAVLNIIITCDRN